MNNSTGNEIPEFIVRAQFIRKNRTDQNVIIRIILTPKTINAAIQLHFSFCNISCCLPRYYNNNSNSSGGGGGSSGNGGSSSSSGGSIRSSSNSRIAAEAI